jgi:hypothetical protein
VTGGSVPDSDSVTMTSAGTYYWAAFYSGDGNNMAAASGCAAEVLTVAKTSPSVSTKLSADTITAGQSAHDTRRCRG